MIMKELITARAAEPSIRQIVKKSIEEKKFAIPE